MRSAIFFIVITCVSGFVQAKEIFSARCHLVLTGKELSWSVDDFGSKLRVHAASPVVDLVANVSGEKALALRRRILALRFSREDVDILRALEVRGPGDNIMFRPFDGVTYYFRIGDLGVVSIDNPDFDIQYHPDLPAARRLQAVLIVVEELTAITTVAAGRTRR